MAASLLTAGCGKFVRDELITMQNEIDLIHRQVEEMNLGLTSLQAIVSQMAANGYIINVEEFQEEERGGYKFYFRTVNADGTVDDSQSVTLYSGVDGKNGKDAAPFVLGAMRDEEDGRWYWYDVQAEDWMYGLDGSRFLVDGKDGEDGKTPTLAIEDGYWIISWDGGETWETTEWKAKGDNAKEIFSKVDVLDDRIELTLAADSTVITLPRFVEVGLTLTMDGAAIEGPVSIAPGDTLSIAYAVTGTIAEKALVVAGTDGRFKTALRRTSATEGFVDVICPEVFPEDGYIYITVNDGNGRSSTYVIEFVKRESSVEEGGNEGGSGASGEGGQEGE